MDTVKVVFIHNETLFNHLKNEASICDGMANVCGVMLNEITQSYTDTTRSHLYVELESLIPW